LTYISAADSTCIGLSLFQFLWWAPKARLFSNRVRIGCSRSSKVDDFVTNRKCVCDFLLAIHSNLDPTLHCFWDTVTYWL